MKRSASNLSLVLFFVLLTFVLTAAVVLAWETFARDPFFSYVERSYPGESNSRRRRDIQQRVEHFVISIMVDAVVVTLLLRLIERKQRAVVESEERYRALFEHASDGICVTSAADHRVTEANSKFCETLGLGPAQVVGRDLRELLRPAENCPPAVALDEMLGGSSSGECEFVAAAATGAELPVAVSFNTLSANEERLIILIVRDLSASKRMEADREQIRQQLYESGKLASLGELSAGVAHEINNPLNGIINFAQLLKDEPAERTPFERQLLDGIIEEGERIATIVRGLLAFARHDTHQLDSVSLGEVVGSSLSLFGRQFQKDSIRVETDIPADLPRLRADASRLRQVVVNLLSNAHHALWAKRSEDRLFRISARGVERGGRPFVRVEFYDNGVGIRQEDLGKVLDPFFTTRRDSGGTGLGLSVSFGIIRDHGGTIVAEGAEGEFARFVVELPAAAPSGEVEGAHA
jgi:PAS domain S-box-containing protein